MQFCLFTSATPPVLRTMHLVFIICCTTAGKGFNSSHFQCCISVVVGRNFSPLTRLRCLVFLRDATSVIGAIKSLKGKHYLPGLFALDSLSMHGFSFKKQQVPGAKKRLKVKAVTFFCSLTCDVSLSLWRLNRTMTNILGSTSYFVFFIPNICPPGAKQSTISVRVRV